MDIAKVWVYLKFSVFKCKNGIKLDSFVIDWYLVGKLLNQQLNEKVH